MARGARWLPRGVGWMLLVSVTACARPDAVPRPGPADADRAGWTPGLARWVDEVDARFDAPTVGVAEVDGLLERATVVDVRGAGESAVSRLPGAVALSSDEVRRAWVPSAGDGPVIVYCTVGWRSAEYTLALREAGVEAYNLEGGVCAWAAAGRPLVDGAGRPTRRIHAYSDDFADCVPAGHEAVVTP